MDLRTYIWILILDKLLDCVKEYIPKLIIKEDQFSQDKDKRNYIVSNEKIEKLGWSPDYNIDIGIQELLAAYPIIKNTLNKNFTNLWLNTTLK